MVVGCMDNPGSQIVGHREAVGFYRPITKSNYGPAYTSPVAVQNHCSKLPFNTYGVTAQSANMNYQPYFNGSTHVTQPSSRLPMYMRIPKNGDGYGVLSAQNRMSNVDDGSVGDSMYKNFPTPPTYTPFLPYSSNASPTDRSQNLSSHRPSEDQLDSGIVSGFSSLSVSPANRVSSPWASSEVKPDDSETDSDGETTLSHPNKFPVEIEYHDNKYCCYKRQPTRSGEFYKQKLVSAYNAITMQPETDVQQIKYYQKHLVRVCRCGNYGQMDGLLQQGRSNDCNGYEIHYSQKCRWKAYDDFKTGKRVLIRLCKCYKPC